MSVLLDAALPDTHVPDTHVPDTFPAAVHQPRPLTTAELTALVTEVAARPQLWADRLKLPEPGAGRWWTRLHAGAAVDVWLLSWLPGQTTELHDHGESLAAFTVVHGELTEDRPRPAGDRITHARRPGAVIVVPLRHRHDVTGAGTTPAVSIHAYSPPLTEMNYYDDAGVLARTVRSHEPEELER